MSHFQFKQSPFRMIFLIYMLFIAVFSFLYHLPFSTKEEMEWLDAIFLSTSAMSVTGLSTVSVTDDLTRLGQAILFIQIQFGGIGIMTILGTFLLAFKGSVSLPNQTLMSFDQNQKNRSSLRTLILFIVLLTISIEIVGFLLLLPVVLPHYDSLSEGMFFTLFHAGASFTNAGFTLFDDQLLAFSNSTYFVLSSSALIFLGVIGFPVILELLSHRQDHKRLSLYTKINLKMHGLLLLIGFLVFFFVDFLWMEQNYTIKERLLNSLFLSFTSRSAGISIIDMGILSFPVLLTIMFLMFIGGSPSSCGGGIRTTTFAVVCMKIWSIIKGRADVHVSKKSLYEEDVNKAILVFFSFLGLFLLSLFVLSISEDVPVIALSFEIMSALSTTGLSLGITTELSAFAQIWLIGLMIIGRLGVVVLIYSILESKPSAVKYSKESMIVG